MDIKEIPFTQEAIKKAVGNGEIEFYNFSPRNKDGMKKLELKVYYSNGCRKIIVLHDAALQITSEEAVVNEFKGREERNREIQRLYYECGISQNFLANFFGISQPSVSVIVKRHKTAQG